MSVKKGLPGPGVQGVRIYGQKVYWIALSYCRWDWYISRLLLEGLGDLCNGHSATNDCSHRQ